MLELKALDPHLDHLSSLPVPVPRARLSVSGNLKLARSISGRRRDQGEEDAVLVQIVRGLRQNVFDLGRGWVRTQAGESDAVR
eukprot:622082-Rhodomonas_salina.1